MTKIFYKEIKVCNECPYLFTDTEGLRVFDFLCINPENGDPDGKILEVYGADLYIPVWCKLPDKEEDDDTYLSFKSKPVSSETVTSIIKKSHDNVKKVINAIEHKTDIL